MSGNILRYCRALYLHPKIRSGTNLPIWSRLRTVTSPGTLEPVPTGYQGSPLTIGPRKLLDLTRSRSGRRCTCRSIPHFQHACHFIILSSGDLRKHGREKDRKSMRVFMQRLSSPRERMCRMQTNGRQTVLDRVRRGRMLPGIRLLHERALVTPLRKVPGPDVRKIHTLQGS